MDQDGGEFMASEEGPEVNTLTRSGAFLGVSQKRPYMYAEEAFDDDEDIVRDEGNEEDEASDGNRELLRGTPDIGAYLTSFHLTDAEQITLCRSWANFLTAKNRPLRYRTDKGKKHKTAKK